MSYPSLCRGEARAVAHGLRQPGNPGPHPQPFAELRQLALDPRGELRALRSRSDQAHLAPEDVDDLGQLVEVEASQHAAEAGAARVALASPDGSGAGLGVGHHGAELEDGEHPAPGPEPALAVEHRAAVLEADGERDDGNEKQPQRPEEDQREGDERQIERALVAVARRIRYRAPVARGLRRLHPRPRRCWLFSHSESVSRSPAGPFYAGRAAGRINRHQPAHPLTAAWKAPAFPDAYHSNSGRRFATERLVVAQFEISPCFSNYKEYLTKPDRIMMLLTSTEGSAAMEKRKAPGKAYRKGLSVFELFEMFPDEASAASGSRMSGGQMGATVGTVGPRAPARFLTRSPCPTGVRVAASTSA